MNPNPDPNQRPPQKHPCQKRLSEAEDIEEDVTQLANTVQRHTKCSSHCLRMDKKTKKLVCRFHFPYDFCERSKIILNEKKEFELVTKRNDSLMNKYNPWVLQNWRANMDISPIMSRAGFLNYLAKYASKAEVNITNKIIVSYQQTLTRT